MLFCSLDVKSPKIMIRNVKITLVISGYSPLVMTKGHGAFFEGSFKYSKTTVSRVRVLITFTWHMASINEVIITINIRNIKQT